MGPRPWGRALAWLAFLTPFFFLSYGLANAYAGRRAQVPSLFFEWERHVPFLAWTILPYWTSDLLYGASLPVSRNREELDRHAWRLLAVQVFSVACFLAFPLQFSWSRPATTGWEGFLFDSLMSFDRPFNQAPSLHVSLAVILWAHYRKQLGGWLRIAAAAWFALVAVSAWTTWQHHFIDLPTGLWAGVLTLAAIPDKTIRECRRPGLAVAWLGAAVILTAAAFTWRGWWWMLLWPAFSTSMSAAAYWTGDPAWLGKNGGAMPPWTWPSAAVAWCNSRMWTHGEAPRNHLADGVWIGRLPGTRERDGIASIVDMTAELPLKAAAHIPVLDLTVPCMDQLGAAVEAIERARRPTLVCCALGYSRSATAAAAWLLTTGRAASAKDAVEQVRRARPRAVIGEAAIARLQQWAEQRHGYASRT